MSKLINPLISLIAVLLAGSTLVLYFTKGSGAKSGADAKSSSGLKSESSYQPRLEHDPPVPSPPAAAVEDFNTFLERLRKASEKSVGSLVLHKDALDQAEKVFRGTAGVLEDTPIKLHRPFFMVNPEAIFALYADLPTLERGLGLYQQHCSQCHGPYGRGNGGSTLAWYHGNYPRNFWYGKFKSRSTEYGIVPTDGDLFRTLTRGLYGSTMPSFRHLSAEDRWALVQFVKSLANYYDDYDELVANRFDPEFNDPDAAPLDVSDEPPVTLDSVIRGRILFIEHGCLACHQGKKAKPVGLARWEGAFDNWNDEMHRPIQHSRDLTARVYLSGSASSDLFRIISGGPNVGPMPNYLNLPKKDRWALVHYIQSIFKPDFPQARPSVDAQAKRPETDKGQ